MLKQILIRTGLLLLLVLIYFGIWRDVRGLLTVYAVIPQVEFAATHCNEYIFLTERSNTSLIIQVFEERINDYRDFSYTAPAGFYLLFGLAALILIGAKKVHYYLLAGFHALLWAVVLLVILPGLCFHLLFLNIIDLSIKYLTPFGTFVIIIMAITPGFMEKLSSGSKNGSEPERE